MIQKSEVSSCRCLAANKLTHTLAKAPSAPSPPLSNPYHIYCPPMGNILDLYFLASMTNILLMWKICFSLCFLFCSAILTFFASRNFFLSFNPICWPATIAHFSMISCRQILHIFSCQSFSPSLTNFKTPLFLPHLCFLQGLRNGRGRRLNDQQVCKLQIPNFHIVRNHQSPKRLYGTHEWI
jgi:hypothetical protein